VVFSFGGEEPQRHKEHKDYFWFKQMSIVLTLLVASILGYLFLSLRRDLRRTEEVVKELQTRQGFKELEKHFAVLTEKQDHEFNTLWEEFENLRKELLTQSGDGISPAQWRVLLEKRIPSFALIKQKIDQIMEMDSEMAAQLKVVLPAYLTTDEFLPGLLDLASMPFERVNWMDVLILPISAKLDGGDGGGLEEPFAGLLGALGYSSIKPVAGEIYRADQHDVIEQRLSASERGTILATRNRGYSRSGNIVKKAKVIISAGQS
jgi:hypothetical protein